MIPTKRSSRITGHSRMNFVALVTHGLSAMSVFSDLIGVRLLITALSFVGLTLLCIAIVIGIKLGTDLAIPGWTTNTIGLLLVILSQVTIMSMVFAFITLNNRKHATLLPVKDCYSYIYEIEELFPERCHSINTLDLS
jgi:hypothetical protein